VLVFERNPTMIVLHLLEFARTITPFRSSGNASSPGWTAAASLLRANRQVILCRCFQKTGVCAKWRKRLRNTV
jgi:hypothetical protein